MQDGSNVVRPLFGSPRKPVGKDIPDANLERVGASVVRLLSPITLTSVPVTTLQEGENIPLEDDIEGEELRIDLFSEDLENFGLLLFYNAHFNGMQLHHGKINDQKRLCSSYTNQDILGFLEGKQELGKRPYFYYALFEIAKERKIIPSL